jgi:hypothetical protein
MDGLTLLQQARDAGLAVESNGDKLVIRGPRRAEVVARLLIEHKPEVIAALAPASTLPATIDLDDGSDPAWWRRQFTIRTIDWGLSGKWIKDEAAGLAWGELQCRWHRLHGKRVAASTYAGCGEPIADTEALDLGDDTRVHFATAGCLIRYGQLWRSAATQALLAMGLTPPCGPEPGR